MNPETLQIIREAALDTLRLYVALITAPFVISKAFATRPSGEPFRWPPEGGRPAPTRDSTQG